MKIGVVGAGYVGLSTAVSLATKFQCVAMDSNASRVADLNKGLLPIHETGLRQLMSKGVARGRLSFSADSAALVGADAVFIAVGTPSNADGSIDLSQVRSAALETGEAVAKSKTSMLVLVRSTVVPGTARGIVLPTLEQASGKKCGRGFMLCSNPEFLREGSAIKDSLSPERIIVGAFDEASSAAARSLFRSFYGKKGPPVVETTPEGAELVKYASNSILATKVSFINLVALASELYPGTDVEDVARGIGLDPRIGRQFLQAGPGFGGSCFPKDLRAFGAFLRSQALDASILDGVLAINEFQPMHVVALAEKGAGSLSGKEVAVLGLAFKAGTSDVRESRSIPLVMGLLARGAKVRVYDPAAMDNAREQLGSKVAYSSSARECISGADVAIAMTAWPQFKALRPEEFARRMRSPVLVDARRMYDPAAYSKKLRYIAVGRAEG